MRATAGKVEFVSYSTWSSFMISKVSNFPFVALHNAMHFGQPVIHYDKYIAEFCDGIRDGFFKIFRIKKQKSIFDIQNFVKTLTAFPSFYIIFDCMVGFSFIPLTDGGKGTRILKVREQL